MNNSNNIEWLADLSIEEINVRQKNKIAEYEFAYHINAFLRGNRVHTPPDPILIQHLDSAIKKCKAVRDLTLYRATCSEDFDRFVQNDIFNDPSFASTSTDEKSIANHFNNAFTKRPLKLIILCQSGTNLLDMELPNDTSVSENEILLPRKSRYKIVEELQPIKGKNEIATAMGKWDTFHTEGFDELRIIKLKLLSKNTLI